MVAAREIMGPAAFLGVEQAVVLDTNADRARALATAHVGAYTTMAPHHQANLRRLGFSDAELAADPTALARRAWRELAPALVSH